MTELGTFPLIAFVPARDAERAKEFYGGRLGLRVLGEDQFAVVFHAGGVMLRVVLMPEFVPAKYTVLGWQVPDIGAVVRELREAGIEMQQYEGMGQDELGIWRSPNGAKVAWFQDLDGNVLSVTEF